MLPRTASKAKKTRVHWFMAPNHPSPTPPPPRPHTHPAAPENGLLAARCAQKTTKNGGKTPETETKKPFLAPPVNPSTALVTGVCVTPAWTVAASEYTLPEICFPSHYTVTLKVIVRLCTLTPLPSMPLTHHSPLPWFGSLSSTRSGGKSPKRTRMPTQKPESPSWTTFFVLQSQAPLPPIQSLSWLRYAQLQALSLQ